MTTEVIKVTSQEVRANAVLSGSKVLNRGGLLAFPTETVYGVAARADSPEAITRLRKVKSRGPDKAFTVHIATGDDAARFAPNLNGAAKRLVHKAWPGPLTIITTVDDPSSVPAMAGVNGFAADVMYHHNTIGLRCPDDDIARALLQAVDAPIVAASANRAGRPAPWTGEDVVHELDGHIDMLIDTGRTKYAKPSTIVRMSGSTYELIREGVYDAGIIERLSMVRILFVCTGNTCRSPIAEALAKRMLAARLGCDMSDLESAGVFVTSAGTAGGFGGATEHAINVMARRELDLSRHTSTALSADAIRLADYIFSMTQSHRDYIIELLPDAKERVSMLLENEDVHDPIGGTEDDYESCAKLIEKGLHARLGEVIV